MPGRHPRCAIYARFSSERQNEKSAEDQVRECRRRAEQEGWDVVQVYTDLAISGANKHRPGLTAMLSAVAEGAFDILLAEDQDRLVRDLEDTGAILKRLRFHDVKLFTLADGEADELKMGIKGTLDAHELVKLAGKVRRGQRSALARGRVPGGLCYGYDIVREFGPGGWVEAGRRRINPEQAAVVVRIYEAFAALISPKAIAKALNAEGIKSPRGGEWRASTIVGNRGRQVGILHNPIYVGLFVYGRVAGRKDPDTRNRVWRSTSESDRETFEMPELRIVSDDLWLRTREVLGAHAAQPLARRRRPRHLFSGLVRCGVCGGQITVYANDRLSCGRFREAGTCTNGRTVRLGELQERVLAGLDRELLSPDAISAIVRDYHLENDRKRRDGAGRRRDLERQEAQADAAVQRLVSAIADGGGAFAELREAMAAKVGERDRLRAELREVEAEKVIALHPQIAEAYRAYVGRLMAAIKAGGPLSEEVKADLRSLVEAIYVRPRADGGVEIEAVGQLASAIALATGRPNPNAGAFVSVTMVAGVGFEPTTFRL